MFNNLTKIVVVFLVMVCFLMLGAFYLRYSISSKLDTLSEKLAVSPEYDVITIMLLDLNRADNNYQEAIIDGDSSKFAVYRSSLDDIFDRLTIVVNNEETDTTLSPQGELLKRMLAGKIDLSSKVFQMKKDFDSLLLNTEQNFKQIQQRSQRHTIRQVPNRTIVITDTIFNTSAAKEHKKRGLFSRLKDAVLNKSHKDSVAATIIIKQKEQLLNLAEENKPKDILTPAVLDRLKLEHINLSVYQQELVLSNLKLVRELREVITNIRAYYSANWQARQKEYLKEHASTTRMLDHFNMFILCLIILFLILLFYYIKKVDNTEKRYKLENMRAVQLAEERSEMLARMSHEIRNPLMAITGFIDLMHEDELEEKHRKMIDSIQVASEMLVNTVNDILDITKFQHDTTKMIEIRPFVPFREILGVVDTMRFIAVKKKIALRFEFSGAEDKIVKGDSFRLKQVLLNLLNNAIKFTDEGEVNVRAKLIAQTRGEFLLTVEVQDTGVGIKKEIQHSLFSKYFQANNSREKGGSGLGLYICKQLIQLQGGGIQVYSEGEQKGSLFVFTIPYKS
ncbi:HAMP domain-containing sensor histidine kinase [Olivibacter ginsenosidimutans]